MSFLDKLLDGVAVEWIEVGKLISPQRGRRLVKSQLEEVGSYAVYQNSMKPLGYYHESNAQAGATFVIVAGSAGEIGFSDVAFWAADDVYYFPEANAVNNKYLYHFLLTKQHEISSQVRRAGVPRLSIATVEKLELPIPCPKNPEKSLEIQAEIVRILDAFTELTSEIASELTSELAARKKQYSYYRDQLLSFEEGEVEWKALGWIGRIVTGRTPKSSDKSAWGDEVDFVTPSDIKNGMRSITCPSRRLSAEGAASMPKVQIPSGSLLVTCIGADMGKTVINANDCIPNQQINAIILTDDRVQVGYLFHVLTAMRDTLRRQGELGGGTMPLINKSDFSKIVVPVPSLEEQARIVAILDKFDTLTNSISEGLPREIELRQKQYEYYRDLLLSFPKQEEEAA